MALILKTSASGQFVRNTNQSCGAEVASAGGIPLDSGTDSVIPALVAVSVWSY